MNKKHIISIRFIKKLFLVAFSLIILSGVDLAAHDLWLEKDSTGLVLCYGHTGASHDDVATIRYDPQEVLHVACFDKNGSGGDIQFKAVYPVTITNTCAVTFVRTSSGYWTRTAFGTKRLPKSEVKGPVESWQSYESVKRIDDWAENLAEPVTEDIELSPTEDPFDLFSGDKVRLLVTVGGKPMPGIAVAYDGKVRGVSDENGKINIRLKHGGRQMIQASYSEPGDGVKTDEIIYTTTLMFEIEEE